MTQQGLDGMRMRTAGPGRQIADKSYYLSELRTKMSEIGREIKALGDESTKLTRDSQVRLGSVHLVNFFLFHLIHVTFMFYIYNLHVITRLCKIEQKKPKKCNSLFTIIYE